MLLKAVFWELPFSILILCICLSKFLQAGVSSFSLSINTSNTGKISLHYYRYDKIKILSIKKDINEIENNKFGKLSLILKCSNNPNK